MIDELNEICDGLVETVAENTAHIEKLNAESDQNRVAIAGNNKRIHQLIDMVLKFQNILERDSSSHLPRSREW